MTSGRETVPVHAQGPGGQDQDKIAAQTDKILVSLEPGTNTLLASTALSEIANVQPEVSPAAQELAKRGVVVLEVRAGNQEEAIRLILSQPGVRSAEPVVPFYTDPKNVDQTTLDKNVGTQDTAPVTDPLYLMYPSPAKFMNFGLAWPHRPEVITSPVTIAILDSGYDLTLPLHPDAPTTLIANPDANFVDPNQEPQDQCAHGTEVAGVTAAPVNGVGMVGVCPDCPIMVVKIGFPLGTDDCLSNNELISAGIYYAVDHGAKVINISWVGSDGQILKDAVNYAYTQGAVVVAGAGNNGWRYPNWPCWYPYPSVVCVSALGSDGNLTWFSTWGKVDFSVYGTLMKTSTLDRRWITVAGTSYASAGMSGAVGFAWSTPKNAGLTNQEILDLLAATARGQKDPPDVDGTINEKYGFGEPDLLWATVVPHTTYLPVILNFP